jgi:hypothetical protein
MSYPVTIRFQAFRGIGAFAFRNAHYFTHFPEEEVITSISIDGIGGFIR